MTQSYVERVSFKNEMDEQAIFIDGLMLFSFGTRYVFSKILTRLDIRLI